MNRIFACLLLTMVCAPAVVTAGEEGAEYRAWCERQAATEQVADEDLNDFIDECVESLVRIDRDPAQSKRGRKDADDEG